jgi:uncharacterized membrane protein
MTRFLLRLFIGTVVFVAIDLCWIGVFANTFYKTHLGSLARRSGDSLTPLWTPAIFLYLLIVTGLVVFVLPRVGADAPLWQTFAYGAVFGLVGYGIYDLTNYATLNNWPLTLTIVDMVWGGLVCGLTASAIRIADGWWG